MRFYLRNLHFLVYRCLYYYCMMSIATVCLLCYCRGITEARIVYVSVFAIVCLAICPHGHHHNQPSSAHQVVTDDDTDEAVYKELKETVEETVVDGNATPAVVLWHHVHTAWLLLMLLLARPQNISLVAVMSLQNVCCRHIVTHLRRTEDCVTPVSTTLLYLFIGQAAFFYQVFIFVLVLNSATHSNSNNSDL